MISLDRRGDLLNRAVLIRLRGRFYNFRSAVELHGCEVGRRGERLVQELQELWGINVYAHSGTQDPATEHLD
jgi:hypothetical protein